MTLSANEKIRNRTVRHMLFLERLKTKETNAILKFYDEEIIPDLINTLRQRLANIEEFGFDRGIATTRRVEQMIEGLRSITGRFRDINNRVQGELFELIDDEVKWQIGAIREEIDFDLDFVVPAAETVRQTVISRPFDGHTLEKWFDNLTDATQRRLGQAVQRGVVEGLNTEQIVRTVRGTRALAYTDGILNITKAQTEAVVRSAIQHATNQARQAMFEANDDLLNGVQWVATLDSRTCLQCSPLDGKVFPVGEGARPPIHVNCRCTVVSVLKSWDELGIDADELEPGMRASIDGQVPETINYAEWLRTQPRSVVEEALGVQKAKLFLDGDLELTSFVTNRRKELTLDQIRQREKSAFIRAGL